MGKNKQRKFRELATFPNTFQNYELNEQNWQHACLINHQGQVVKMAGRWSSDYFKNDHPIVLELACGRGEYAIAMAKRFPEKNFIGIDIKGNRIWGGASTALEEGINNVAFVRTRIELLHLFFGAREISEIWITFPDPFLPERRQSRRLTHTRFLKMYRKLLAKDGVVHLKTDSEPLYIFTKLMIEENQATTFTDLEDVYSATDVDPLLTEVQTKYESMHLKNGLTIKYLKFGLT